MRAKTYRMRMCTQSLPANFGCWRGGLFPPISGGGQYEESTQYSHSAAISTRTANGRLRLLSSVYPLVCLQQLLSGMCRPCYTELQHLNNYNNTKFKKAIDKSTILICSLVYSCEQKLQQVLHLYVCIISFRILFRRGGSQSPPHLCSWLGGLGQQCPHCHCRHSPLPLHPLPAHRRPPPLHCSPPPSPHHCTTQESIMSGNTHRIMYIYVPFCLLLLPSDLCPQTKVVGEVTEFESMVVANQ